jgi:hypothetical protein
MTSASAVVASALGAAFLTSPISSSSRLDTCSMPSPAPAVSKAGSQSR